MKKLFLLFIITFLSFANIAVAKDKTLSITELSKVGVIANSNLSKDKLERAKKIISDLHKETLVQVEQGYGPFRAAIYDENGNLIAKMPNTVVKDRNALRHAEMNTIREAHKKLKAYDLAPYNLSIYITAEPCIMCTGGIMWSGIKNIYYSVSSKDVERITGFDEGYKPNWIKEFKKRNIKVYGNIDSETGRAVLKKYVESKKEIYKPSRT